MNTTLHHALWSLPLLARAPLAAVAAPAASTAIAVDCEHRYISQPDAARALRTDNFSQTHALRQSLYANVARMCHDGGERVPLGIDERPAKSGVAETRCSALHTPACHLPRRACARAGGGTSDPFLHQGRSTILRKGTIMNVPIDTVAPLPEALNHARHSGLGRRHRIGDYDPDRAALRRFNDLLRYLDFSRAPLDGDQLASAARELVVDARQGAAPRCIGQRMRRGAAIDLMAEDVDWETRDEAAMRAGLVVSDYLRDGQTVIPNALPVIGRLDDAIVVETAWPAVAAEMRQYLAFCRIRHMEAQLRGESTRHFGFTREQFQDAMRAEAEWIAHCGRVSQASYLPSERSSEFRIH